MKRLIGILALLLLPALPLLAAFCSECGIKLAEGAKFCSGCGTKAGVSQPIEKPVEPPVRKTIPPPPGKTISLKTYRTKTELYVYEKRGDEQNVLKKNLFFKPRRFKLARNARFEILEEAGSSCLIQSVPEAGERAVKGWVTLKELLQRTDWEKK